MPIHVAAENGHKDILQYLFNNGPLDLDCFMVPAADEVHYITLYCLPNSTNFMVGKTLASFVISHKVVQYITM